MFYISISNGLLEGKHRDKMGTAVWEYMWCIDKVTKIDEDGTGWVLGGKPMKLSEISAMSENTTSRNLNKLEENGYINLKHTSYGVIITVNKAKKRFTKIVEPTSPKMVNLNPKNGEPLSIQYSRQNSKTGEFEKFWNLYPKKVDKRKSEQKWNNLPKTTQELILLDLPKRNQTDQWQKNSGQFVPNPTTYLNGERWNDQISSQINSTQNEIWKPPIDDRADINSVGKQKFDQLKANLKLKTF